MIWRSFKTQIDLLVGNLLFELSDIHRLVANVAYPALVSLWELVLELLAQILRAQLGMCGQQLSLVGAYPDPSRIHIR